MCMCVCVCMYVCVCVRHSPGRRQQCFAVKAGWGLSCCKLSSASVMAPSAALDDPDCCSVSGTPEEQCTFVDYGGFNVTPFSQNSLIAY